jgi:signal transduction histidine kinase
VSRAGEIVASNGRLEVLLGVPVLGCPILDLLDAESSRRKWERIAALHGVSSARWELVFRGARTLLEPRPFTAIVAADAAAGDAEAPETAVPAIWLVEHPADARVDAMAGEMEAVNAELATTQRALVKEQRRLAAALRELERSNAALDEFARAASHDLKAPLRAILDYAELLETEAAPLLPEESRHHLARVGALAAKMRGMVDAVLEYARAGQASESAVETADSSAVLREVVDFLEPPRDVAIEIADGLPTFAVARVPFEQVFRNLLANAIRYRREAGAEVRVSATDAADCWHFVVADNGPGIAPWQHERIWQLFQTTRPKEGSGVGLALVKRLVDVHGGRVWVESEQGAGARFHVLWPKQPKR